MNQAERLRLAIADEPFRLSENVLIEVTVSVGATAATANGCNEAESLLRVADAALYRAKERGRNCVEGELVLPHSIEVRALSDLKAGGG
jgi:diguanylate cyclase (GGDEF)-like protein